MNTNDIAYLLKQGKCVVSGGNDILILNADGSVVNNSGAQVLPADSDRVTLYGYYSDRAGELDTLSGNGELLSILIGAAIEVKGGVQETAPDVSDYELGDKYIGSGDCCLYELVAGTPDEDTGEITNEWDVVESPDMGKLYIDIPNGFIYVYNSSWAGMLKLGDNVVLTNQLASTATTAPDLKTDFNALLTKLKEAGIMAADSES